jgi:hypothetical protein
MGYLRFALDNRALKMYEHLRTVQVKNRIKRREMGYLWFALDNRALKIYEHLRTVQVKNRIKRREIGYKRFALDNRALKLSRVLASTTHSDCWFHSLLAREMKDVLCTVFLFVEQPISSNSPCMVLRDG